MTIEIIPVLEDNYCYVLTSPDGVSAVIDPGEGPPVISYCKKRGIVPSYILNTHHHWDHTDDNEEVAAAFGAEIIGPEAERHMIPKMGRGLCEGDVFMLGSQRIEIIETPGHTLGHICFYVPESEVVFTGDTLFSLGIGRLFEGTVAQQFASLDKLKALPDHVLVYCGHEYTQDNIAFAEALASSPEVMKQRITEVNQLRAEGKPSVPVSLGVEKATNPFLNVDSAAALQELINKKTRAAVGFIRSRL
jgi:hydroxyacylglutathione hydrolase